MLRLFGWRSQASKLARVLMSCGSSMTSIKLPWGPCQRGQQRRLKPALQLIRWPT